MNPFLISIMSGPLMALVRYGVTAGAAVVASKGWVDGSTIQAASAALIGLASAGIGALTSTKTAAIVKVQSQGLAVVPAGRAPANPNPSDPTWANPNAR